MKKILIIVTILAIIFALYFNRAYAHIFLFITAKNMANPTTRQTVIFPPKSPSSTAKITYVALGDSLTAGVGATAEKKSYPYLIAQLLAQKNNAQVTLINLGQPGAMATDVLNQQVPQLAKIHPDFITLAIGINDMHNKIPAVDFQNTLAAILNNLTASSQHVNVITIPYLGNTKAFLPPYRLYFDQQTKKYNNFLNNALVGKNVSVINLYDLTRAQAFDNQTYYSDDGFHPSDEGYKFWSNIIYDHLNY